MSTRLLPVSANQRYQPIDAAPAHLASGSGSIIAAGTVVRIAGTAAGSGAGSVAAAGTTVRIGAASLAGAGALSASSIVIVTIGGGRCETPVIASARYRPAPNPAQQRSIPSRAVCRGDGAADAAAFAVVIIDAGRRRQPGIAAGRNRPVPNRNHWTFEAIHMAVRGDGSITADGLDLAPPLPFLTEVVHSAMLARATIDSRTNRIARPGMPRRSAEEF